MKAWYTKACIFVLILATLLATVYLPVYAEGEIVIEGAKVSGQPGDTVIFTLTLTENAATNGLHYISVRPKYDTSVLTYVSGSAQGSQELLPNVQYSAGGNIIASRTGNTTNVGTLVSMTFQIAEDAPDGAYPIELVIEEIIDYDTETYLSGVAIDGCITVCKQSDTPLSSFEYTLDETNKTLTITGFTGSETEVSIAPTYTVEGVTYTVTTIADEAFYGCESLTGIVIPDTVTAIGDYALYDCTSLTDITVEGSPEIGELALGYYNAGTNRKPIDELVSGVIITAPIGSTAYVYVNKANYAATENDITFACTNIAHKGCQLDRDFAEKEAFNIRFASIVDSLDYYRVGYTVTVVSPEKSWESETREVYGQLMACDADGAEYVAVTAAELGGEMINTITIRNIPKPAEGESYTFIVTPYVLTRSLEGVLRYDGRSYTVTVSADGTITQVKEGTKNG